MRRFFAFLVLVFPVFCFAQDFGFGFGFDDESDAKSSGASILPFTLNIAGEISAGQKFFFNDFKNNGKPEQFLDQDFLSAKVNFSVPGKSADSYIGLDLSYGNFAELQDLNRGHTPGILDEAWVRGYFGPVNVQAGFMKLTWGRMYSYGPLDVVNPLDYTDLSELMEPKNIKIARPMIHAAWSMGPLTKLEAVFVPWFQGDKFATSGRWAPGQVTGVAPALVEAMKDALSDRGIPESYLSAILNGLYNWQKSFDVDDYYIDYNRSLNYAQAGLRFTTTVASSDFGFQYYFGRFQRPRINIGVDEYEKGIIFYPPSSDPNQISIDIDYSYYHQIGADFARVIGGFNLRAEAGANITGDLDGTDGTIENPSLVWALGFDRDLLADINFNIQGTGKVRLFHSKIGKEINRDCEAGNLATSTRLTGIISRKFFREELELKATGLWGIEERDFLIMPAFIWSRNDVKLELSAGFFGGSKEGELGQYRDNAFVRMLLSYKF